MFRCTTAFMLAALLFHLTPGALPTHAQQLRVDLNPTMLTNEADVGDPAGLVDEQRLIVGPPAGAPKHAWTIPSQHNKRYPFSTYLDLGEVKNLSTFWIYDTNGTGKITISAGTPGQWQEIASYDCGSYLKWASIPLEVTTRYLRITRVDPGANFTEIAVYEYTPEAYQEMVQRKAEEARRAAEREAALKAAREAALKRPIIELAPYGRLSLVDEIDCASTGSEHLFAEVPSGASRVESILGSPTRVLSSTAKSAAYFSYRIGKMKLLRPGGVYVLTVEYPQDQPRTILITNTGNETTRGFHTGLSLGDAMHPKYVNNFVESLDLPLSGKWETWSLLIRLHDRFPAKGLVRGSGQRPLTPEDGFDVVIGQFSAPNLPLSHGAAVRRIALYEVLDPEQMAQPVQLPPQDLPRRRLFWREEMADGVLGGKNDQPEDRGLVERLDWYRHKAELMRFLGMNTYTKDLLEFGACQHWDSTPHGGNQWVYFDSTTKDLWGQIVELMGQYGFDVLPYYEYSGSKGSQGLGNQRRAQPLTRDDAYTHIKWIETANADVTDPDTLVDFQKMLEITVLNERNKAKFAGVWIRPRSQMPVSFSDNARGRFAQEANAGKAVTRQQIAADSALYERYLRWWETKRQAFFTAVRDYLRQGGINDAFVLYTGCPGEPGVGFAGWDFPLVTEKPDAWQAVLQRAEHLGREGKPMQIITPQAVAQRDLYLQGLLSPGLDWGGWEVRHARPADDPQHYHQTEGVLLSHAFNRLFTVLSPRTMDLYRAPAGLALVRHYALNENMMFGDDDKTIQGYFVADVEYAGPFCMISEVQAMATGDPTMIGYLAGNNFGRGFPQYVRSFNSAFLALPALPSTVVADASSDPNLTVRAIRTPGQGTWYAVVWTGRTAGQNIRVKLPAGKMLDAVTGTAIQRDGDAYVTSFHPYQLRAWWCGE